ncbi:hypothetical protein K6K15_14025 (plasmid) [Lacticaseibacillus paracasei]|uniref:hypothetical protein n=1 Tax=Lacticaseibacillus paracasei TaxID=1597 RepID=UPI00272C28CD|nr:hypothetical protein [Lacticaseibacillus paracasei]WKZ97575.1 hypothetical protein K6K15_14025 [Lacticaseibacillus paracasei]
METVNLILSIFASIIAILSSILGLKNWHDLKKINSNNKLISKGNNNLQQVGGKNSNGIR